MTTPLASCSTYTDYNTETLEQVYEASGILSIFRSENYLNLFLRQQKLTSSNYIKSLMPFFIPLFVFVVGMLYKVIYFKTRICRKQKEYCFKRTKIFPQDKQLTNQTPAKLLRYLLVLFIMSIISLIASITYSSIVVKKPSKSVCTLWNYYNTLINPQQNWIGFSGNSQVLTLATTMNTSIPSFTGGSFTTINSLLSTLNTNKESIKTALDSIYTTYQSNTVTIPEFSSSTSYTPYYINQIGPSSDSSKTLFTLKQQIDDHYTSISNIITALSALFTSITTTYSNILQIYTDQLGQDLKSVSDWHIGYNSNNVALSEFESYANTMEIIMIIVLTLICLIFVCQIMYIVLIIFLIKRHRRFEDSKLTYIGRMTKTNLLVLFIFCLATGTIFPYTVFGIEACDITYKSIKDWSYFNATASNFPSITSPIVLLIAQTFNSSSFLDPYTNLEAGFTALSEWQTNFANLSSQTQSFSDIIQAEITKVQAFKTFEKHVDEDDASRTTKVTDHLKDMNSLADHTNEGTQVLFAKCRALSDQYVFSASSECDASRQQVTTISSSSTSRGSPTCLQFDQVQSVAWLQSRYATYNFGNEVNTLFGNIETSYSSIQNVQVVAYQNTLNSLIASVTTLNNNISPVTASFGSSSINLSQQFNNRVSRVAAYNFANDLCTQNALNSFSLLITLSISLIITYLASFALQRLHLAIMPDPLLVRGRTFS